MFQLNDSAKYFFDEVERFADPNYVPSEQVYDCNRLVLKCIYLSL